MTAVSQSEIVSIPLNKLAAWKDNVRKTGAAERLEELHEIELRMLARADFLSPHRILQQVTEELGQIMLQQRCGGHRPIPPVRLDSVLRASLTHASRTLSRSPRRKARRI